MVGPCPSRFASPFAHPFDRLSGRYEGATRGFLQVKERFPATPAAASALYWAGVSSARAGEQAAALEYLIGYLEQDGVGTAASSGGSADLAMREIRGILAQIGGPDQGEAGRIFEEFYRRVDRSPSLEQEFKDRVRLEYARYTFSDKPDGAMAILQTVTDVLLYVHQKKEILTSTT